MSIGSKDWEYHSVSPIPFFIFRKLNEEQVIPTQAKTYTCIRSECCRKYVRRISLLWLHGLHVMIVRLVWDDLVVSLYVFFHILILNKVPTNLKWDLDCKADWNKHVSRPGKNISAPSGKGLAGSHFHLFICDGEDVLGVLKVRR